MFLTDEQARARLDSEKNLANKFKSSIVTVDERTIKLPGKNKINLTSNVRTEIAIRSRLGESREELAEEKSISPITVTNIKKGHTKGIDEKKVESAIAEVRDKALDRLMASLGLLSDDKLTGCSAKDLSVIASNMGRVVEKTHPKSEAPDNINFIIYAPELKQEKSYEVIEI